MRSALGSIFPTKWRATSGSRRPTWDVFCLKSMNTQPFRTASTAYMTSNSVEDSREDGLKHKIHYHHQFFANMEKSTALAGDVRTVAAKIGFGTRLNCNKNYSDKFKTFHKLTEHPQTAILRIHQQKPADCRNSLPFVAPAVPWTLCSRKKQRGVRSTLFCLL